MAIRLSIFPKPNSVSLISILCRWMSLHRASCQWSDKSYGKTNRFLAINLPPDTSAEQYLA
ncbi:hypothetical protein B7953_02420 [Vibrio paracholerae]|nr:hypothetical protein B7953_02420 [Vibrio paracholerae]